MCILKVSRLRRAFMCVHVRMHPCVVRWCTHVHLCVLACVFVRTPACILFSKSLLCGCRNGKAVMRTEISF